MATFIFVGSGCSHSQKLYIQAELVKSRKVNTPNAEMWTLFPKIQGKIRASSILQNNHITTIKSTLLSGMPGGIMKADSYTLLLIDGEILGMILTETENKDIDIRAYGIIHDKGRAMTPLRIEYILDDNWKVFDLPYSGILGSGALGGDE